MKQRYLPRGLSTSLLAIFTLFSFAVNAQEFPTTRVAVVSVEKVFGESNMAKATQKKLELEFAKRQNELRDSMQKIKTAAEKLDRDAAVMSEADRIRKQRELADQDRELQRKQREFTEDLNQRNFEERAKIAEKANVILRQIAEQRKIDLIVQDAAYVSPKVDITDDVIKALNNLK
jgi:outer membrane protein